MLATNNASPVTVTQLNNYIKLLMDNSEFLSAVTVVGEISNFKLHAPTGHIYMTLKDGDSLLKAVMFRSAAEKLNFTPMQGSRVVCHGRVTVFARDGSYQLYVDRMEKEGIGSLFEAFERLKKKLLAEGLFDSSHKKALPFFPKSVGVVTSSSGAALQDIIKVSRKRCSAVEIVVYPASVQGTGAAKELLDGVEYFNNADSVDVIIIGRGGGSIEDLWAFNDEQLARAVYASKIPVVSAVGHETDFSICDFAADLRAATPSAAAEMVIPDAEALKERLMAVADGLASVMGYRIDKHRRCLEKIMSTHALSSPFTAIDDKRMAALRIYEKLSNAMERKIDFSVHSLKLYEEKLKALSPLAVLSRGYGIVLDGEGGVIKSVSQLPSGKHFRLKLSDGDVEAQVENK